MRNNIAQQVQLGLQRWAANFSSFRLLQLRGHNFSPRFVRSVLVPQSWPSLAYASQVWAPFLTKAQRRTISTRLHQYVRGALRMRQRMPLDNTVAGKSSFTYPLSNYIILVDTGGVVDGERCRVARMEAKQVAYRRVLEAAELGCLCLGQLARPILGAVLQVWRDLGKRYSYQVGGRY